MWQHKELQSITRCRQFSLPPSPLNIIFSSINGYSNMSRLPILLITLKIRYLFFNSLCVLLTIHFKCSFGGLIPIFKLLWNSLHIKGTLYDCVNLSIAKLNISTCCGFKIQCSSSPAQHLWRSAAQYQSLIFFIQFRPESFERRNVGITLVCIISGCLVIFHRRIYT